MKKKDITVYLIFKRGDLKIDVVSLFISCIISIFSLSFSANIFCFFHTLVNEILIEKILFVIMIGFALIFIAALRFSFFSFVKSLAEKYELLLILGIKTKDFWRLVLKEFFCLVFLLGLKAIIISNIISIFVTCIIFYRNINILLIIKQFLFTVIIVFSIYVMILLVTMFAIIYNRKKKNLIDFFGEFSKSLYKGHTIKNEHIWKLIFGIALLIISYTLLIDFRVEKMILAILLNIAGAFLLIRSDEYLIKKLIKKFKNIYYEKILIWSDLVYQYKINSYLVFMLYILNFFLVYLMGGLLVSVDSEQTGLKYPYETIVYSDSNIYPQNSYQVLLVNILDYGSATAISNNDYNRLLKTKYKLGKGEVLFIDEREREANLPLTNKEIKIISKGQDGKGLNYNVGNAEWKVIFGQNVFRELNGIVVLNDEDFALLLRSKVGAEKFVFLSNQIVDRNCFGLSLDMGGEYWNRTQQIEEEVTENKVVIILIYMISLTLILEGQAFIFTKQIVNLREESYCYDVLRYIGIKEKDLEKIIEQKIKGILMIPGVLAIINGIIFFVMDSYQEPNGITLSLLLNYGVSIMIFYFIQIFGCYLISTKMKKNYMNR